MSTHQGLLRPTIPQDSADIWRSRKQEASLTHLSTWCLPERGECKSLDMLTSFGVGRWDGRRLKTVVKQMFAVQSKSVLDDMLAYVQG